MKRVVIFLSIISIVFLSTSLPAEAENNNFSSVYLDRITVNRGYTLKSNAGNLVIGLWANVLNGPATITIENLGKKDLAVPEDKNLISDLYVFNFKNKTFKDFIKPYTLTLKYRSENSSKKAIYFYNKNLNKWSEVKPSFNDEENKYIRVKLKFPYAQLAILEEKPEVGMASWYKYKEGLYTAHPVYPKGTRLKVTSLENNKSVIVIVNDWGPDRAVHPERIIDLDAVAFKKIGKLSRGVVEVKVEKL